MAFSRTGAVFFRQAGVSYLELNITTVGLLCSTGITLRLRSYEPLRLPASQSIRLWIPLSIVRVRPAADWISQVPRSFFRRAPSAITPAGRLGASADCFPHHAGFTFFGRLATCIFVFRGRNRFNLLAYGSPLRCPVVSHLRLSMTDRPRSPCSVTFT